MFYITKEEYISNRAHFVVPWYVFSSHAKQAFITKENYTGQNKWEVLAFNTDAVLMSYHEYKILKDKNPDLPYIECLSKTFALSQDEIINSSSWYTLTHKKPVKFAYMCLAFIAINMGFAGIVGITLEFFFPIIGISLLFTYASLINEFIETYKLKLSQIAIELLWLLVAISQNGALHLLKEIYFPKYQFLVYYLPQFGLHVYTCMQNSTVTPMIIFSILQLQFIHEYITIGSSWIYLLISVFWCISMIHFGENLPPLKCKILWSLSSWLYFGSVVNWSEIITRDEATSWWIFHAMTLYLVYLAKIKKNTGIALYLGVAGTLMCFARLITYIAELLFTDLGLKLLFINLMLVVAGIWLLKIAYY